MEGQVCGRGWEKMSAGQARDSATQNDEAEKPGLAHSVLIVTAQEFVLMIHSFFLFYSSPSLSRLDMRKLATDV